MTPEIHTIGEGTWETYHWRGHLRNIPLDARMLGFNSTTILNPTRIREHNITILNPIRILEHNITF
jgi:hypothetical protein